MPNDTPAALPERTLRDGRTVLASIAEANALVVQLLHAYDARRECRCTIGECKHHREYLAIRSQITHRLAND